jgi:hypothetical protein
MFDHDDSATAAGYAEARKEKAKHTPGPWRYNSDPRGAKFGVHVFLNEIDSFALGVGGGPDEQVAEDLANARLIAAAPDLLAAIKVFLHALYDARSGYNSVARDVLYDARSGYDSAARAGFGVAEDFARAAIARAEGRAP